MSVHYKFKAALDYSTVTFDGIHISVADLKKEIIEQKRLAKNADFDLQIQNAQTKEVYADENALIPKNTSVIVARVPITEKKRSSGPPGPGFGRERFANQQRSHLANLPPVGSTMGVDLTMMDGTEEEKIKAMMSQSTADFDPSRYMKIRGQSQYGKVPDGYTCYKCHKTGHWIKNCPMAGHDDNVKKSTGIPRSFMVLVDGPEVPGALITPEGQYAVPAIDHETYSGKNKAPQMEPPPKPKIPEHLICPLCQDLLTDALLVPCCANSYCDECIRSALLDSEDQECPGCHEKETSPNDLIPNRFLRSAVNAFKNETGYSKPVKLPDKVDNEKASPHKEAQAAAAAERKMSLDCRLDDLPDDLFPHSPRRVDSDNADNVDPTDSKDLYDFNDGSIPSPFAKDGGAGDHPRGKPDSHQPPPAFHGQGHGPPPMRDFSRPPPSFRGPPQQQYGHGHGNAPPHDMRMSGPPQSASGEREPPPPGFDVQPPGEERAPMMRHGPPPGQHQQHHGMGRPDDRQQGPPSHHGPPPHDQRPPGHMMGGGPGGPPGPFNPMQPPPGFQHNHGPPPGNMQRPPHMGGPPGPYPPGPGPYPPPGYNRPPPGDMYGPGPGPGPYQMDRHRDDFRGRGPPPRRPFPRDNRMGTFLNDENRPGAIEDPLKEFERIMREKDRRKQQMGMGMKKRSKSRSPPGHTPPPRRPSRSPSPFRKRSPSPSYTRSPSPKRTRIYPLKRRNSFSRSRSRTPPAPIAPPPRRPQRSRSRSRERERVRSISPHSRRRSPRRAPPYSPSPPSTSSRFVKQEKDEYYDHHSSSRYDDRDRERDRDRDRERDRERHSRHLLPPPISSKHHSSKEYDLKYEDSYRERGERDRYSSPAGRHDSHRDRYDYKSARPHSHHTSNHGPSPSNILTGSGVGGHSSGRDRERERDRDRERERDKPGFENPPPRRVYEYEPTLAPPGTEAAPTLPGQQPPSLLDLNIPRPGVEGVLPIGEKSSDRKAEESKPISIISEGVSTQNQEEKKEHKRRKSLEEKKLKKEKKKHRKEKKEEKKKEKSKRKKSKDSDGPSDLIPLDLIKTETPQQTGNAGDVENSLEMKLTAPCDSTVKSPERLFSGKEGEHQSGTNVVGVKEDDGMFGDAKDISLPEVTTKLEEFTDLKTVDDFKPVIPIPTSKWDLLDDFVDPTVASDIFREERPDLTLKETKVPLEVLRRAENVIFDKVTPVIVHSINVSVTEADDGKSKKITLTDIGILPPETNESDNSPADDDNGSKGLPSSVFRKPLRDRLGNKVSEDEALRSKEDHTRKDSDRDRVRERERDLEREKDKKFIRGGRRSRSKSRSPVPAKRPRERSPRSPRRDRERLPDLRLLDRERERPRSREREDRDRDRNRDRERDFERDRTLRRSRSRDRERDLRDRDRERDRSGRDRGRDIPRRSRSRDRIDDRSARRPVAPRSPQPLFSIPLTRPVARSPEPPRHRDRGGSDSHNRKDSFGDRDRDRKRRSGDLREPTPPGVDKIKSDKDPKTRSSDKTQDGGSGVAVAFSNPFSDLGARKGKQRINIKLSSTAKLEKESSSSSEEHEEDIYPKPSTLLEQPLLSVVPPTSAGVLPSALVAPESKSDEEASKKKKKAKKRKSDSSSSSSSDSSDEKHKKSKKSKKKKKKSKKKKK